MTAVQTKTIRVLIVDDHPIVREGLAAILSRREDMEVVGEAGNGIEALCLYEHYQPDVTLMDLRMPESDGVEAIQQIRERFPGARIVVLTTFDGDEDIYRGLRAGAKAFLLKDAPREKLLEVVRAVHAGQTHVPLEIAAKLAGRMSSPQLTPREMEVLQQMSQGKSNIEIGNALFIAEGTVKAHINSILSKLNASDRTQAVTSAIKRGLVHLN